MNRKETGALGEDLAIDYILSLGFVMVSQNTRFEKDEVDIIAKKKGNYFAIEVKTMNVDSKEQGISALDHIDKNKIEAMKRHLFYISMKFEVPIKSVKPCVVTVYINKQEGNATLKLYENIPLKGR